MDYVFDEQGEFAAMNAAEAWCAGHGLSVGQMQRGAPRGLLMGNFEVAKWRNLTREERAALHGLMTGDMRHGPINVHLHHRKG